ncbi:MAG: PQQ-binding-like beta-propeller repeat protein [Fuerstiella sp.]
MGHGVWLVLLLLFSTASSASAGDWPQFLGPHRTGISEESGLIDSFPASGPPVVWRTPLGVGMSSISVVGNNVYTMYQDAQHQYVVALDARSGEKLWQTRVAESYRNAMGNGPRATPTVLKDSVFAFTGEGILCALNRKDGELRWSAATHKEPGGRAAEYGMASSPLVVGQTVVVQTASRDGAVAGYDVETGKRRWAAGNGAAGYSSPVLMKLAGRPQIVAFVGAMVLSIDPADGSELWRYDYVTDYDCNTASPLQLDDSSVLVSAGENHGSTILKVTTSGDGLEAKPGWSSLGKDSVLRAEWQTPVLHDGHLFALDNVGSAGPITNLVCVRIADGQQVWRQPRFGKSNLMLADGKLFLTTMKGELVLVKASTNGFEEISRATILQQMTRQAPVIAAGRLYLRDDSEVVCLDVSK